LSKVYAGQDGAVAALEDFSCDIAEGEFAVILGPSGCGKSTVVRIIAGLEKPSSGTALINGEPPAEPGKNCSMVFQSYTSFPWLTVLQNIAFGLRYSSNGTKQERWQRAREFAHMVGLEEFENASIGQLSGGMKQRVAIASALATDPKILLMDEPFGALDSQTRMAMQEHLLSITEKSDKTVVFVTHDIEEALLLGDRIYVCSARPASILAEFDVPFGHPRTPAVRNEKRFVDMKYEIFHLLRDHTYEAMLKGARDRRK
jgi:ABC-type nitrate/sulfonate/bicarbonate transport system ATPase subunit